MISVIHWAVCFICRCPKSTWRRWRVVATFVKAFGATRARSSAFQTANVLVSFYALVLDMAFDNSIPKSIYRTISTEQKSFSVLSRPHPSKILFLQIFIYKKFFSFPEINLAFSVKALCATQARSSTIRITSFTSFPSNKPYSPTTCL